MCDETISSFNKQTVLEMWEVEVCRGLVEHTQITKNLGGPTRNLDFILELIWSNCRALNKDVRLMKSIFRRDKWLLFSSLVTDYGYECGCEGNESEDRMVINTISPLVGNTNKRWM